MIKTKVREKIENVIYGEGRGDSFPSAEWGLRRLSVLYAFVLGKRAGYYLDGDKKRKSLPAKVISVGNIALGGTGKTPMTMYLAGFLSERGYRVVILSRGYKGLAEETGGVVSDGEGLLMQADRAGDEPYMMAARLKGVPVLVGKNRVESGMLAVERFAPDVILLDDGFQHLKLCRDIDLVLLDGRRPFGNGFVLPGGPLREPLSALDRADAFVMTRSGPNDPLPDIPGDRPVFRSRHQASVVKIVPAGAADAPDAVQAGNGAEGEAAINGASVFVFSGISDNRSFLETVKSFGCSVSGVCGYSDHHMYSDGDLREICDAAVASGADYIATTEKDYVRFAGSVSFPVDLAVIGISINFDDDTGKFKDFICSRL